MSVFTSIDDVQDKLSEQGYVCSRALATVVFLSLKLGRPLFLEGEAGVGKTEIAKAMAEVVSNEICCKNNRRGYYTCQIITIRESVH